MKKFKMWLFLAMLLPALFTTDGLTAAFDRTVIFGDSLSDEGLISDQPLPDPDLYYEGRFSNGWVWIEYLVEPERLNTPLTNRALSGAESDGVFPPGLKEQVFVYVLENDPLSPNTLFVIWIGGNDYLNSDRAFEIVVANIKDAMEQLVEAGAANLLILNLPNLGTVPATTGTPEGAAQATAFSIAFNTGLAEMLDAFSVTYPAVALYEFDVFAFFQSVRDDPAAFGFIDVDNPSPNFSVPGNFEGAGHVFWDDLHPTTEMHAVLADSVFTELSAQLPPTEGVPPDDSSSSCFIGSMGWGN